MELEMMCADRTDSGCWGVIPVDEPLNALTEEQLRSMQSDLDAADLDEDRVACELELTEAQCKANYLNLDKEDLKELQAKGTLTYLAVVRRQTCAACGSDQEHSDEDE
ncbi:hypothetical protein RA280_00950 [Cupriavidus sp. CV2]|uniref:hypothetical protein n=1 Tax=Cupriavidus ulmosensis TaxID=3065913 RepID=UPI00296ACD8A|nr:hypothetical protein [Cupriavidus sp. CV2]MDW3680333.1 hypothetical protein [Cupriavidus sp. CV2]